MQTVFDTLFPVFSVIALGYILGQTGFFKADFLASYNRLIFYVALPALIVSSILEARELPSDSLRLLGAMLTVTLAGIGIARLAALLRRLRPDQIGTFTQAAFRGNLAFVGIPIITYSLRSAPAEVVQSAITQAIFVFAPTMVLFNLAAVLLLVQSRSSGARGRLKDTALQMVRNPLIIASVAGLVLRSVPLLAPPRAFVEVLGLLAQTAAPGALLAVGGSMAFVSMQGRYKSALLAAGIKVAVLPAVALLVATVLGIEGTARLILLILAGCPTAAASYIMARQLGGDEPLAAGSIVLSTILAIPSLGIILYALA